MRMIWKRKLKKMAESFSEALHIWSIEWLVKVILIIVAELSQSPGTKLTEWVGPTGNWVLPYKKIKINRTMIKIGIVLFYYQYLVPLKCRIFEFSLATCTNYTCACTTFWCRPIYLSLMILNKLSWENKNIISPMNLCKDL
jgi:hypothetical protein